MVYGLNDLLRAIRNPALIRGEIRKFGQKFNKIIHQSGTSNEGTDIFSEDWDNLIILDGCRYDTFEEVNNIPGELEFRISKGSTSWEFFRANFSNQEHYDTVYITANPHLYRLDDQIFHSVIDLVKEWDENKQTVPPDEVVSAAESVSAEYPEKRYIFHFMQPHYPFIGKKGKEIDHRGYKQNLDSQDVSKDNIWDILQWGKDPTITEEQVQRAYTENLDIVLNNVEQLLEKIEGRTIITADHGNLIGDRLHPIPVRGYGHPGGLRSPELVKVPWHIIESEDQRKITTDPPQKSSNRAENEVEEQLSALGYTD